MTAFDTNIVFNIERFIRKYFKNKLINGLLLSFLLISVVFLLFNFIEYFAFLPGTVRLVMFYSFLLLLAYLLVFQVGISAYRLLLYRKSMPLNDAARLIGRLFPNEVNDQLLNTLQLKQDLDKQSSDSDLLMAAIVQKEARLNKISFATAIHFFENRRVVWTAVGFFLFVLFFSAFFPEAIVQPSQRILAYNKQFIKPLPFEVSILNTSLELLQHDDFLLEMEVKGEEIPTQFFIEAGGVKYAMDKSTVNKRSHLFKKVGASLDFFIVGGPYESQRYTLVVRPKPLLLKYEAQLIFPSYINRVSAHVEDLTYLMVPEGTKLEWKFFTRDTDELSIAMDSLIVNAQKVRDAFVLEMTALQTVKMQIAAKNAYSTENEGLDIFIEVIKDEFPSLQINQLDAQDELKTINFFTGIISDDYGFSNLRVQTKIFDQKTDQPLKEWEERLVLNGSDLKQQFFHSINLDTISAEKGQKLSVQFILSDNDAVNGPKTVKSRAYDVQFISLSALDSISKTKEENLTQRLETAVKKAAEIKLEAMDLNKKLMLKRDLDANDQQKLGRLMKKQNDLNSEMESLKKDRKDLTEFNRDHELKNESLLEKQQRIDELLEKVIPEDIRKMMEELEKLLLEMNKDQMSDILKKMEMSGEELEQLLDRNLALLEQLQVEKAMDELTKQLDQLAEELKENAEKTDDISESKEQLNENLKDIQEAFKKEMRTLDSLRNVNQDLEQPFELQSTDEQQESIEQDMQEGSDELSKNKRKTSKASQKSGAEKMKALGKQLEMMMKESMNDQQEEDAEALRFLLENILRLSIHQEDLLTTLSNTKRDDPAYVDVIKSQSIINESFRVVNDSLVALSKRQPMIENFVFTETANVKRRMEEIQSLLKDRLTQNALNSQQYTMMGLNNLALLLDEALKKMQESMGMPSPQDGKGKGKGKGKEKQSGKSLQNMREMQEALGQQLKDAMDGKKGQGKGKGMSEEMARMAAQQEALRNELKQMIDGLKSEGQQGDQGLNSVLEQMEKFEEDLVNKRMNQQLLELNNEIVVRLLESEKALKEREQEERRESEEFKGKNIGNSEEILEYKRMIEKQRETLRTNPIDLHPFYKRMVNAYYLKSNTTRNVNGNNPED